MEREAQSRGSVIALILVIIIAFAFANFDKVVTSYCIIKFQSLEIKFIFRLWCGFVAMLIQYPLLRDLKVDNKRYFARVTRSSNYYHCKILMCNISYDH